MAEKYIIHPHTGERVRVGVNRVIGCRPARMVEVVVWSTRETFIVPAHQVEYVFGKGN